MKSPLRFDCSIVRLFACSPVRLFDCSIVQLFVTLVLLLISSQPGYAAEPLKVIVGVPPYAYLAERIGGEYVQVQVLLAAGQDPHTFEPSPKRVMALGGGRLFFSAGLEFEEHLIAKIQKNFRNLQVVDLSKGFQLHEEHHDHHDPHIWLSPTILVDQAGIMARTLQKIDPLHHVEYDRNLVKLQNDLRQVRGRIAKMLAPFRGRSFLVYHPAFAYFGKDFGLQQVGVEANGNKPSPRQLATLLERARNEEVKIIFVQPQFDQASAKVLATSIGGAVLAMDPLAKDVLKNFSSMAEKLEKAFQ